MLRLLLENLGSETGKKSRDQTFREIAREAGREAGRGSWKETWPYNMYTGNRCRIRCGTGHYEMNGGCPVQMGFPGVGVGPLTCYVIGTGKMVKIMTDWEPICIIE